MRTHGVDPTPFGVGTAKRMEELATEVANGETTLEIVEGAPRRNVRVLQLLIRDEAGRVLIEAKQEWDDGRVRERGTPLSEKLLRDENWRDAAPRAVAEELGSALSPGYKLELDETSFTCVAKERDSLSYPGLPSRYLMHSVEARIIDGFPAGGAGEAGGGEGVGEGVEGGGDGSRPSRRPTEDDSPRRGCGAKITKCRRQREVASPGVGPRRVRKNKSSSFFCQYYIN